MANICSIMITYKGNKENLDKFEKDLENMKSRIKDADQHWLGNLVDYDEANGFYYGKSREAENELELKVGSKWAVDTTLFEMLKCKYSLSDYVYMAEEGGCGIYINTDKERSIYLYNYCVIDNSDFEIFEDEDYETLEEILEIIEKDKNISIKNNIDISLDNINAMLEQYDITVHEYTEE